MSSTTRLAVTERFPEPGSAQGPLVVLVHGSLDRSASFGRVVRRLDDLHTVAYDRRGYHRSRDALPINTTLDGHIDDLLEVVDDRPAVVIGHSYGGAVALGAALRDGARGSIRSLGVYEPPMPWLDFWPARPPDPTTGDQGSRPVDPNELSARAAERFFRRMVGDAAWERLPEREKAARRADGAALSAELDAIRLDAPPFDVRQLAVPVVCGRGENSAPRHRDSVAWLVDNVPGAELFEIPGAGHGAHLSHPDAFAAMVRRTVARAEEPGIGLDRKQKGA
jgi:pimeloyl-ACP methyl ester carboxylesterase